MLRDKTITALRAIAEGYGIPDLFNKTHLQLVQAIELKQSDMTKKISPTIPVPEYDGRLMNKPPSKKSDEQAVRELLKPHTDAGLVLGFENEYWYMAFKSKTDTGSIRMPLKTILHCANQVMK